MKRMQQCIAEKIQKHISIAEQFQYWEGVKSVPGNYGLCLLEYGIWF